MPNNAFGAAVLVCYSARLKAVYYEKYKAESPTAVCVCVLSLSRASTVGELQPSLTVVMAHFK
jgi:hypothetical protein